MEMMMMRKKSVPTAIFRKTPGRQSVQCMHTGQSTIVQSFLQDRRIQPRLGITRPEDQSEREADRVAEQVVSNGAAGMNYQGVGRCQDGARSIQRMCAECEEEMQLKPDTETTGDTAARLSGNMLPESETGKQLPAERRNFFESRMGHRFDDVRVHTGKSAARLASAVNARAYTLGRNIVFNEGQYRPGTRDGDKLLAHELTHVIQQRKLSGAPVQRSCFDGNCEDCAGGIHDLWVTVFFARRANRTTMQHLRTAIDGAKTILRNCCINLKFDFNWTLIPNASTIETASRHPRPAGSALGLRDVPEPQETIGESDLIAGARGIPLLVVDEVEGTGGGTTILGGQDDRGNDYDIEYTGPSMFFIAVNQPNPNGNCNHIAHEIWHITGALRHAVAEGGITACANNNVSETYCNAVRGLV